MTRRAYLYFVLTFLLGVLVGGAGAVFYGWYTGRWQHKFDRQRILRHLRHDLNLSDSQAQHLDQILQDTEKKFKDLHAKTEPEFEAVHQETRERIRRILNPDQLARFNEMVRRFDEMRKSRGMP